MQLTLFTDYALRMLMYLALAGERLVPIAEVADAFDVSTHYMLKVAQELARLGYIDAIRGRNGGVRLAVAADKIGLGELVRKTEPPGSVLECVDSDDADCAIVGACRLRRVFRDAQHAFHGVLDRYTLADILTPRRELRQLLQITPVS
jgi:Rrf2 family nitric oxide-sensitive transcriptional repressor